ncbi:MAG: chromate resistance protein ChrB domain-containing protein [Candidatus Atabeyarchaeum deiterrae]
MQWVTRTKPHVDRCASAWLIKRFIDQKAKFEFISKDDPIPEGSIAFTLRKAEIKPVEGKKTTYDALLERYNVRDPAAIRIGKLIHDFEIDAEESPKGVKLKETLGLCYILKGLEKTSETDSETIEKAIVILDALRAILQDEGQQEVRS